MAFRGLWPVNYACRMFDEIEMGCLGWSFSRTIHYGKAFLDTRSKDGSMFEMHTVVIGSLPRMILV